MTISKIPLLILALIIGGWSHSARADQPIGLIQTLCIPEPGVDYFSARLESFAQAARYINDGPNGAPKDKEDRLKVLEKYGLIFPNEFSYTCKLEHHTYTITGHRPLESNSECMGDPRVSLSLKRDNETVFEGVFFEPSCFDRSPNEHHAYIESFAAEDEVSRDYVEIVYSNGQKQRHMIWGAGKAALDQKQLSCLEKSGYIDRKSTGNPIKECTKSAGK